MKGLLQKIFSVKNVGKHKKVVILGLKLKFKRKKNCRHKIKRKKALQGMLSYDKNREASVAFRHDAWCSPEVTGIMQYHLLNKIKELELKEKVRKGHKIRVAFVLDSFSKFSTANVYLAMCENSLFVPFIVLYQTNEIKFAQDNMAWESYKKELQELRISKGEDRVFAGYDEFKNFIPLETYKPDIVFTNSPYLDFYYLALSNIYLNVNFLVCQLNYSLNTVNNYEYHYNNRRFNCAWKYFVETRDDYKELMLFSRHCGMNAVLTGYPKLDAYAKEISQCRIHSKIDNGKPIVIYAPHWTVGDIPEPSNLGTFELYYNYFLELVKKHRDINFVFKPHSLLGATMVDKGFMSVEEYQNYIVEWDSQPNGLYVFDGEYIDLFRKSALMITDSGSFIGEWLPSGKPCMYMVKPKEFPDLYMEGFSLMGRKILQTYYLCHNQDETEAYFNKIMFEHTDPMKESRERVNNDIFVNVGCASQKIVDYLVDTLRE